MHARLLLACAIPLLAQAVAAQAADIAIVEAPPVAVSPDIDPARFGWGGAYVGVSAGYAWLKDVDYAPAPGLPNPLYDQGEDWVFGAHAGYLHQFGPVLLGAEVEAMRLDIDYEFFNFITVEDAVSAKARGGVAWDRLLLSAHAGGVYARTNFMGLKDWGWTAGAGVDYAITDHITLGAQYSHYEFTEFDGTRIDATIDLVTARFGYKF